MKRKSDDEPGSETKHEYEESYGDPDRGGWAPRERFEDFGERSHYSSQRDHQEDRAGFSRGFQGEEELLEKELWSERHARSDEDPAEEGEDEDEDEAWSAVEAIQWLNRVARTKEARRQGKSLKKRR